MNISLSFFRLKELDIATMKALEKKVNIIPIIAKADSITKPELLQFKTNIIQKLKEHKVNIYQCPTDDPIVAKVNQKFNVNHNPIFIFQSLSIIYLIIINFMIIGRNAICRCG